MRPTQLPQHHDLADVVAANVRLAMRLDGVTGVAMCEALHMAQSSWSRRETGRTPFTVDELWLVAEVLGRDPGWFFRPLDSERSSARSSTDRASDYGSVVSLFPPQRMFTLPAA